jgi:hypothetical protein
MRASTIYRRGTKNPAPAGQHWFDALVKSAAHAGVSRRHMMGGVLGAGAALSGSAGLGGVSQAQPAPDRAWPVRPGACFRSYRSGAFVQAWSAKAADLLVEQETVLDPGERGATRITRSLTQGRRLVYRTAMRLVPEGPFSLTLSLGEPFAGARQLTLSRSGASPVMGSVDGRAFTLPRDARGLEDARFVDRRPAPRIMLRDLSIFRSSGPAVANAARSASQVCQLSPGSAFNDRAAPATSRCGPLRDPAPAGGWTPRSRQQASCDRCYDRCNQRYPECLGFDDLTDPGKVVRGIFEWITGAPVAICLGGWAACMAHCRLPGEGCCPVPCGPMDGLCCGAGTTCVGGFGCCPSGRTVCDNHCCGPGVTRCGADRRCGCPDPFVDCGDVCIDPRTQICCNGTACEPGSTCVNGGCCRGNVCASGQCCDGFGMTCCGGSCCNGTCVDGVCCPSSQTCGSTCCAPGQQCLDRNRSLCGTLAPADCGSSRFSLNRSCQSQLSDGRMVSICCHIGRQCCNGQCCGWNEICCWYNNRCQSTQYVCGPA